MEKKINRMMMARITNKWLKEVKKLLMLTKMEEQ